MAEDQERKKQYTYGANSNLVIQRERGPRETGPSGEVETLSNKTGAMLHHEMGSRTGSTYPELERRKKVGSKKRQRDQDSKNLREQTAAKINKRGDVLSSDIQFQMYTPSKPDTERVWTMILSFVEQELGAQPHEVIKNCADLALKILKKDKLTAKKKHAEINELFFGNMKKSMNEKRFTQLLRYSTLITDYHEQEDAAEDIDEDMVFLPDADEDENYDPTVLVDEKDIDDEDETGVETLEDTEMAEANGHAQEQFDDIGSSSGPTIQTTGDIDGDGPIDDQKAEIDVKEIKGFWLQGQLNKYFPEASATESQKKANAVLDIMGNEKYNMRECENILVNELLGFQAFQFIKVLMRNRWEVVYCTKLDRSTDEQKKEIEQKMSSDPRLKPILDALNKTTGTLKEKQNFKMRELRGTRDRLLHGSNQQHTLEGGDNEPKMTDVDKSEYAKKKMLIDLESLEFKKGGHFMSNINWKLPPKTETTDAKGYIQISLPLPKKKSFTKKDVKPISELPEWTHKAFAGNEEEKLREITSLNPVQSKCYHCAFETAENMLLCAPTGAGKTNVALLAILREIGRHRDADGNVKLDDFKIVYVAPMKSLVREMVMSFTSRLTKQFGIVVKELSGDQQLNIQQINETQIIVTTPEKWDIITRKTGDRTYTELVKLVIVDEIHLLHDVRGPVLEAIISRTIRRFEQTQEVVRLVGLSATLPNYEDVAMFLRVKPDKGLFFFDSRYRPCPLSQSYIGVTAKRPYKQHQLMNQLSYQKTLEVVKENQQVLVFVHSRKETANTARFLREMAEEQDELDYFVEEGAYREMLIQESENVKDQNLKELLQFGFAIHHAGMTRTDRSTVEDLFDAGAIKVLVSTATLAWGVNLPAHCVIIKGTQVYSPEKGRWVELSMLDVMQMTGRAGRPGKDTKGIAYILTTQKEMKYYISLLNEQLPIESQLVSRLADSLNAEIVLGTIRNMQEAVDWLYYTYLYVRMLGDPELYGVSVGEKKTDPNLVQRRYDLIHSAATILDKTLLIKYDRKGGVFQSDELGKVASHYYITNATMAKFQQHMKHQMSDIEIIRIFALADEFANISVREEEEKELAYLVDKVPIPVKEECKNPTAKVNILLQAYISRLKLDGFALIADMQYVTQSAARLMRALFTIALKRGWSSTAQKCLALCKMIDHRMWGIETPLRQFRGRVAPPVLKTLETRNMPWDQLVNLDAQQIGALIRFQPQGRLVQKFIHTIPALDLTGRVQPITRNVLKVELTLEKDFTIDPEFHFASEPFWILVEDVDGETILHHEYFLLKSQYASSKHNLEFTIPLYDPQPPQYFIRVISDRWLGSEAVLPITFRNLILPEKYPPPTELLDLQPLPVTCFDTKEYSQLYQNSRDGYFNAIQTQTFNVLYKSDDTVLLAAPSGSGKITCAEFAVLRMIENFPQGKCVYVAPLEALAEERFMDWSAKFGRLGKRVVKLTGDVGADHALLRGGHIIISTAEHWDVLSRRWKNRRNVQNVNLFIFDELHLIGGNKGHVLEVVVSRTRYMIKQLGVPTRIIGISASVANAMDMGLWIGCKSQNVFHFHPGSGVRPVRLDVTIQGFDVNHYESRQLAMVKPAYLAISTRSQGRPVIVFTPTRKICRRVAVDFMNAAISEGNPNKFRDISDDQLAKYLKAVEHNRALHSCMKKGILFFSSKMTIAEKRAINRLFSSGCCKLLVAVQDTCWGMTMKAHMVVVMGTKRYHDGEHRYVDYPITDIIQMMGRASNESYQSAKCAIYCHTPRKDYYKKFLYEPFPVESHLDHYLGNHLLSEIVTKTLEGYQDAVDFLTWTFLYRRLSKNPNYYNLTGYSQRQVSDYLSELVEDTVEELEGAKCIQVDAMEFTPLNYGHIAAYYGVHFQTIEMFTRDMRKDRFKIGQLIDSMCTATEILNIPVRRHEEVALKQLSKHLRLRIHNPDWTSAATKANVLLQCHFSRIPLKQQSKVDMDEILKVAPRLLQCMVDCIASGGWLKPALAAMEICQMVTQGLWDSENTLMQLPHTTKEIVDKLKDAGIDELSTLQNFDGDVSYFRDLIRLTELQCMDIVKITNDMPDIDVEYDVERENNLEVGRNVIVNCSVTRNILEGADDRKYTIPSVFCPRYPGEKTEGWWILVGDKKANQLWCIKRLSLKSVQQSIQLTIPTMTCAPGKHLWTLYLMSDSYLGLDTEYEFDVTLKEKGTAESDSEESSEDDSDMSDE